MTISDICVSYFGQLKILSLLLFYFIYLFILRKYHWTSIIQGNVSKDIIYYFSTLAMVRLLEFNILSFSRLIKYHIERGKRKTKNIIIQKAQASGAFLLLILFSFCILHFSFPNTKSYQNDPHACGVFWRERESFVGKRVWVVYRFERWTVVFLSSFFWLNYI